MQTNLRYLLILVATGGGIYLTWLFTQPELVGHWHVIESLGTDGNEMQGIYHFNVDASGEIRVNESIAGEYVLPGYVEKLPRKMNFGGECWYVNADYSVWGRRMRLSGENGRGSWHAIAYRTETGDCDPERDYFAGLPLDIRLPEMPMKQLEPLPDVHLSYTFHIGQDRETGKDRLMAYRYRDISEANDLDELVKRMGIYIPPDREDPVVLLFQDKSTDGGAAVNLLREKFGGELRCDGYYRVYRALSEEGDFALGVRWVAF